MVYLYQQLSKLIEYCADESGFDRMY